MTTTVHDESFDIHCCIVNEVVTVYYSSIEQFFFSSETSEIYDLSQAFLN